MARPHRPDYTFSHLPAVLQFFLKAQHSKRIDAAVIEWLLQTRNPHCSRDFIPSLRLPGVGAVRLQNAPMIKTGYVHDVKNQIHTRNDPIEIKKTADKLCRESKMKFIGLVSGICARKVYNFSAVLSNSEDIFIDFGES
ncbi:hypothetical protein TcasGA2_TC001184 [Tribolium castaneum]|uniref:Uncharacterized protein n=1 Tax=Tribolium castaneum TaxID=7070 RepID=D6WAN2_TRICA|nr:hypothetical protein TcasGA2_TC001184 [Tribolium castaneum]